MNWPGDLDNSNPLFSWLNRLKAAAKASMPLSNNDIRVIRGPGGSQLQPNRQAVPGELGFHPFEIYRFPRHLRRFKNADDGQRFKVHGGTCQLGLDARSVVHGTDYCDGPRDQTLGLTGIYGVGGTLAVQVPPTDNAAIVPGFAGFGYGGWNEILVGVGNANQVDVWISFVADDGSSGAPASTIVAVAYGKTADLGMGATNLATGVVFNDVWPGYPDDDQYHVYIGTIWILDASEISVVGGNAGDAIIIQSLRDNVVRDGFPYGNGIGTWAFPIQMRWIGQYDNAGNYWPGDVVTDQTGTGPGDTLKQWVYDPDSASAYYGKTLLTPMVGVDPNTHSPDPWKLMSITTF